ncbi:MAG: S26 family signal peptidase, partial [Catalinimonas sp.]
TPAAAAALADAPHVVAVTLVEQAPGTLDADVYPRENFLPWNADNFGPLLIPARGQTVPLNDTTRVLYGELIDRFEGWALVEWEGDTLYLDGLPATDYTFRQDYYFMLGDNRHASLDSRYWGLVPEDHVVGKAVLTWLSLERDAEGKRRVRWDRVMRGIE